MRGSRISHPLPDGKGFFVSTVLPSRPARRSSRRRIVSCVVAVVAAFLAVGTSARAVENVSVTFIVNLGRYQPEARQAEVRHAECTVSVPENADGMAILEAATQVSDCIDSYDTDAHPTFGEFVRCIDDICQAPEGDAYLLYWALWVNGQYSQVGSSGYEAKEGDEFAFNYDQWVTCLTPVGC